MARQPDRNRAGRTRELSRSAKDTTASLRFRAPLTTIKKRESHTGQGVASKTANSSSEQRSQDSSERPLFHPLRWRGFALIGAMLLLEWLALAAVLGLLLWGAR